MESSKYRRQYKRVHYNEMLGIAPLLMLFDALTVYASGHFCAWLLSEFTFRTRLTVDSGVSAMIFLAALALPLIMHALGAYREESTVSLSRTVTRIMIAWLTVVLIALSTTVAFKTSEAFSRAWLGIWALFTWLALFLVQASYWAWVRSRRKLGVGRRRVALVGTGGQLSRLLQDMRSDADYMFEPVAIFGDGDGLGEIPNLGGVEDVVSGLHHPLMAELDEVWLLQSGHSESLLQKLFLSSELEMFDVRLVPDIRGFAIAENQIEHLGAHLLIALSIDPQRSVGGALKKTIDYVGAAFGVAVLSPLMILIALAVKLDSPGPVIYRQLRHGQLGKRFDILKFRTMRYEVGHRLGQPLEQVAQDDRRVTRAGRFLRKWSLDELPQLFNVLRGEMSLVGPRPHEVGMNLDAAGKDFRYRMRHRVKPGITGWAQVSGYRGPATTQQQMETRLQHDLWYIDHWSVWLDVRILLTTVVVGLRHANAY